MLTTRTRLMLGGTIAALAVGAPLAGAASTSTLKAALTGRTEVPQPGDPDGKGQATIRIKGSRVCFSLAYSRVAALTDGHIHKGPRGKAGPPVIKLFAGKAKTSGCVSTTAALARQITRNPGSFYVNLHNPAYPGGAIRGQLRRR